MKPPKVIVLILSFNGKSLLDDSVSSYLDNDYENFEVVVIDNGSIDGTEDYVKQKWPEVTVYRTEKNLGYSGGFNFGLDYAFNQLHADYVLITNNDVKADKKVVSALVSVAEADKKIGFVTGKAYYYDNPDTLQTVGKYEDPIRWNGEHIGGGLVDEGQFEQISERIFVDDIFMLASRDVYTTVGDYDTTFFFQAEEFDWQARAKNAGFKIYYTPNAKIWHKESMTIGKRSAFKAFYDARNPMLVILKHQSPEYFRRYFWYHLKNGVVRSSLMNLKNLRPKVSLNIWQGFLSGILWGIQNKKLTMRHLLNTGKGVTAKATSRNKQAVNSVTEN
ncbi:MAG TPA: glycosyltransferase family 2 protein [Saprospiraceae bacterium]|nr:glycosyltransferase family 2 protein [Lewinellaceae bacterium]HQU58124.1 glycosyltransferase family 2 protein [Saprospiraceae bacterium]